MSDFGIEHDTEIKQKLEQMWYSIEHPDAWGQWVRFWSSKEVQLDGDFTLPELKMLVSIMESLLLEQQRKEDHGIHCG